MPRVFHPPSKKGMYSGEAHIDDLLGSPCPSGYLAAGFMEMNTDLRVAYDTIAKCRDILMAESKTGESYIERRDKMLDELSFKIDLIALTK